MFQYLAISRIGAWRTELLYDRKCLHDYAIQAPYLMIEAQKGQIQECQAKEELGLEWKSPDSQYSSFSATSCNFFRFVIVILPMSEIKQNEASWLNHSGPASFLASTSNALRVNFGLDKIMGGGKNCQTCSTESHHRMSLFQAECTKQSAARSMSMKFIYLSNLGLWSSSFPFSKPPPAFPVCENSDIFFSLYRHTSPFIFQR